MIINKCPICGKSLKLFYNYLFDDRYGAPGRYSVYRCVACGFGRTEPVLRKEQIGRFYSKYYPLKSLSASQVRKNINLRSKFDSWISGVENVAHMYIKKSSYVLDVGSASGASLLEIKKLGGTAYGVEPDPRAQGLAKALGLNVFKGFLTDDPFPERRFDYVTASQVIEHESDPKKFLESARKKLDRGGQIILSFPSMDSFYRKIFGKSWINWHVPYHINHFSKKSIRILAERVGLKVTRMRAITPNLWTVKQIERLFIRPEARVPSQVWTNQSTAGSRFFDHFSQLIGFMVILPNRILDLIGQGDSLLVFLETK